MDLESRLAEIPQIKSMIAEVGGEEKMFSDHEEETMETNANSEPESGQVIAVQN